MNNYQSFLTALQKAREASEPLLDVCITDTDGSSYRKSGARMLIDLRGEMTGLVTGGCLEGELVSLAPELLRKRENRVLEYDMRTMDPNQCVLGPGCNGRVRVRLTCLHAENDYGYLGVIEKHYPKNGQMLSAIDDSGDFALEVNDQIAATSDFPIHLLDKLASASAQPKLVTEGDRLYLLEKIVPARKLTILGAAADARILATMAQQQGFHVVLSDHREAYIKNARNAGLEVTDQITPEALNSDAVVIMSHDFDQDAESLRLTVDSQANYIGLLGPADRRERLMTKAGLETEQFQSRLYSPAGLDIGADTSEQIALAILAEIHMALNVAAGGSLRQKNGAIHA